MLALLPRICEREEVERSGDGLPISNSCKCISQEWVWGSVLRCKNQSKHKESQRSTLFFPPPSASALFLLHFGRFASLRFLEPRGQVPERSSNLWRQSSWPQGKGRGEVKIIPSLLCLLFLVASYAFLCTVLRGQGQFLDSTVAGVLQTFEPTSNESRIRTDPFFATSCGAGIPRSGGAAGEGRLCDRLGSWVVATTFCFGGSSCSRCRSGRGRLPRGSGGAALGRWSVGIRAGQ